MPLRIAFDMDGVLADMESELVRQAETLFGPAVKSDALDPPTDPQADPQQTSAETAPDNVSPLLRLNITLRQQRKLWRTWNRSRTSG